MAVPSAVKKAAHSVGSRAATKVARKAAY